ncbi:MAG: glycosyltransferase [Helicobacteraceae bacterium]|nr:glycosyltransferase [Helicobacteraceae bacterium]
MTNNPLLSIIVPCYNEQEVVEHFLVEITKVLITSEHPYEIIFINDGSRDNTFNTILSLKEKYEHIRLINLSRNFGKEAAMTAGLNEAKGELIVPIDVDLQDPPELILEFLKEWRNGYDVVVAKRVDRTSDSVAKRFSANLFYRFHNKISNVEIPNNVGDYRLITRKVLNAIQQLPENQRFMKGIFAWVGFKSAVVEYKREERHAGESSFNGWKLWNFALDGITSFSTVPLRVWLYVGILISATAVFFGMWIILKTLLFGVDTPGYASTLVITLFLGGIQLMGIGILGEYIGRLYMESKNRPVYIIENEY